MNFIRNEPEACVMLITPEIAKQLIETSVGNRRTRGWYINLLSSAMKRGEWRVTSQGIGIDSNGHLRDAHHRLYACVHSKVSFQSVVVLGMRPDAYEVTDTGINRSVSDRLGKNNREADAIRLGCSLALSTSKPTVDQMRPIIETGFGDAVHSLIEYCGSTKKYYSSAPIKLSAAVTIMNGGDSDYVLQQYRALCTLDFENMSKSGQALVRQVDSGKSYTGHSREVLARGFRVFDKDRQGVSKIQISDSDIDSAVELVRSVLRNSLTGN